MRISVKSKQDAFEFIKKYYPQYIFDRDEEKSTNAGYNIYTAYNTENVWISDLETRLELNEPKESTNIWIDEDKCSESNVDTRDITNYEKALSELNIDTLAKLNVALINVNNEELYWVTSTGQLLPYNMHKEAIQLEKQFLAQKVKND